jgi:hypothetical protein
MARVMWNLVPFIYGVGVAGQAINGNYLYFVALLFGFIGFQVAEFFDQPPKPKT